MPTQTTTISSINPAAEQLLASLDSHSPAQVEAALAQAHRAFLTWRQLPIPDRAAPMRRLAALLRKDRDHHARLMTLEMGKPIRESLAEVEKCAWACEYYAEHAARFLSDEAVETNARRSFVAFEPLGLVLAVMPWNFPYWQVIRAAAPAVMAGNGIVLKHASNVPQCALALEAAFRDAGFPEGLFRTLLLVGAAVEPLIADPRIRAVTLTGSSETGARIAAAAGRALKKTVLELGGSDPFIVLADADLPAAVATAVRARNQNTGQSCIAAKRFIVVDEVAAEFEAQFAAAVAKLKIGDPLDPAIEVGTLARGDLRDTLESQVEASVQMGAKVLTGAKRWGERGFFYLPTVLANVTREMPVFAEETFGPVAAVMRVANDEEALAAANASQYGLGANLWTRDLARAEALARRIESGQVFINGMVASDPRLPFGGVKNSGYGRELGEFGIREFVNIQTIWIGPAASPSPLPHAE